MAKWNSSPHPISDIRDWSNNGRLELKPDFQRREVWSSAARIMLIDTILREVPMPKIFLASSLKDGHTHRIVIDGQQRLTAILDFLRNKFSLDKPYVGPLAGRRFDDLDENVKGRILSYKIDFNEAYDPPEEEIRDVYSRVNKYTVALTKQELRKADFPGDFLVESEELSILPFFDDIGIFTPANRRRSVDVEYISELLGGIIAGAQDKKSTLDDFYRDYAVWKKSARESTLSLFRSAIDELLVVFESPAALRATRFRQKSDFYSLFLLVCSYRKSKLSARGKQTQWLQADLKLLDAHIAPESDVPCLSEYAIKCVSQANSSSSRRWRHAFLSRILDGTYKGALPDAEGAKIFYEILEHVSRDDEGLRLSQVFTCPVCGQPAEDLSSSVLTWSKNAPCFQLCNARWTHVACATPGPGLVMLERPTRGKPNLL